MPLTIRDTKTTPREKWRYPDVNGKEIIENSYMNLTREVAMHYRTNGQEPPTPDQIIKYLCDNVSVPCFDGREPYRNFFTDPPTFMQRGKPSPDWGSLNFLKLMARDGDKGLGDIVARVIGPIGGEAFKKWFQRIFGRSCGCSERQDEWNLTYPLILLVFTAFVI